MIIQVKQFLRRLRKIGFIEVCKIKEISSYFEEVQKAEVK